VTITVTATTVGNLVNVPTVSGNSLDSNTANNSASATTIVYNRPSIGLGTISYSSAAGSFGLSVNTVAGITYILEYKNALSDVGWTEADRKTGTGSPVALADTTANVPMRFYRVRLE